MSLPAAPDPAALAATMTTQLAGVALPPFAAPQLLTDPSGAVCFVAASAPLNQPVPLGQWFPLMPSQGGTGDLARDVLLAGLAIGGAHMVYVNASQPLAPAALAALLATLGEAAPRLDGIGPDPVPAGGVLLFDGAVTANSPALAPVVGALGTSLPDLPVAGLVDFSSEFPDLTIGASLGGHLAGDVGQARIELVSPLYPTPGDARVRLLGGIALGSSAAIAISAEVVSGGPIIATATVQPGDQPEFFGSFAALPGLPNLVPNGSVDITLQLARGSAGPTVERLDFAVSVADWAIVSDILVLDAATIAISVIDPLGDRLVLAGVSATAALGKGATPLRLAGTATYPSGVFTLALAGAAPTLGGLLQTFGIDDPSLEGLAITQCQATYDRMAHLLSVGATVSGRWQAGPFELDGLSVAFTGPDSPTATVTGQFVLGGVVVAASASYGSDGWAIEASAVAGPNGIPLGALLADLSRQAGISAPDIVSQITLDSFSLSYLSSATSAGKKILVTLSGSVPVGPGVRLLLNLDSGKDTAIDGLLSIGSMDLALHEAGGVVTAKWQETDGKALGLADLAGEFGLILPATVAACDFKLKALDVRYEPAATPPV